HGAHGYLILNFLSPYSNIRDDEYGGDVQGRTRFAREIVELVRQKVGDDFPVFFRLSADEHVDGGLTLEDSKVICQIMEKAGVDVFDISSGNHDSVTAVIPPSVFPPGFRVHLAQEIKQVVSGPVITSGRINTPELAESILREGKADLIAIGRGLLADPEFANKAAEGRTNEIRKCIACNQACIGRKASLDSEGESLRTCTLNPLAGREGQFPIEPAETARKIAVVGGGVAGMEAALVAALRGHEVVLFEKDDTLGGQLKLAAIAPYKSELTGITSFFESQFQRLGVKLELGKEITPEVIEQAQPQAVIIATGATPIIPQIPGAEGKMVTAWDVLKGKEVGENVVVAGGGIVGCETAEFLGEKGKKVTIVEKLPDIAQDLEAIRRSLLRERLAAHHVDIKVDSELERMDGNKVITSKGDQIPADTVVLALGVVPDKALEPLLRGKSFPVYYVGDCDKPGNLIGAIHGAFYVSRTVL
ncbi:FAD-dependent oxidoreductase, partial [Chloroflexota bacterium]